MKMSAVIPAYNESANIQEIITELQNIFQKIEFISDYEIIVVDDHSSDDTFSRVESLPSKKIQCIRLSKRSGSHTSIRAGLQFSTGDNTLCISADGQDDPSILQKMLEKQIKGSPIVWGLRNNRNEPLFYKTFTIIFYSLLKIITRTPLSIRHLSNVDFFLLDKTVVQAINQCSERNTSLFGLLLWIGFEQSFVEYKRRDRKHGKSKWNFSSRIQLAKDWLIAFSGIPLTLATYIGIALASLGFVYSIILIFLSILGKTLPGWAETTVLILVIGGVQMLMLGIIGEYLWRNLDEARKRPLFFIEKKK